MGARQLVKNKGFSRVEMYVVGKSLVTEEGKVLLDVGEWLNQCTVVIVLMVEDDARVSRNPEDE